MRRRATQPETKGTDLGSIPPPKLAPPPFAALKGAPLGWGSASSALDRVQAVPTIFLDFNRAMRVGGLPVSRLTTVHGVTHGGKTAFIGGLIRSFVEAGHIASYVDAEHATPEEFFIELLGRELKDVPNFFADRSKGYEATIDKIDAMLNWIIAQRKDHPGLASINVVDSINKLVPKRELERLKKDGGDGIDKGWGRLRAAYNQAWLDHLIPMLSAARCAFVVIAQERDEESEAWGFKEDFKVKGGKSLLFDASNVIRVSKSSPVRIGDGKDAPIVGFKHRARIWKSKVSHMDGRHSDCVFHLSNGQLSPAGFDIPRDAVHVANQIGMLTTSGSWITWNRKRWQGEEKMIAALHKDAHLLAEFKTAVTAAIEKAAGR